ncbi:hypothetical protein [Streptomyces chartreusis]|uniref:hypothetical protein n=1 Tax=Streptomyces chartreusis TaxID=1969 RepID=UPI0038040414
MSGIVRPPGPVYLETGEEVRPIGQGLDPRWEWINVTTYGGGPEYVKGACRHLTPAEVRSVVTGELLAHLCPDCDAQLPAEWRPDGYPPIGLTRDV